MSFWESVVFIVSGAGTFGAILGIFFGLYARQNGRATGEFIAAGHKEMRDFIATESKEMREFLGRTLERLGERISEEGEKTREEMRRLRG